METLSEQFKPGAGRRTTIIWFIAGVLSLVIAAFIGISDNLPGILLLLFGCFAMVYAFLHRAGATKNFSTGLKLLYWSPRLFCIVFAAFTVIFALDVFGGDKGVWQTIVAFIMHLIPTFLIIALLIISWRWEWLGGIVFILLALLYIISSKGRAPLMAYILICGCLLLISILFFLNWLYRNKLRPGSK